MWGSIDPPGDLWPRRYSAGEPHFPAPRPGRLLLKTLRNLRTNGIRCHKIGCAAAAKVSVATLPRLYSDSVFLRAGQSRREPGASKEMPRFASLSIFPFCAAESHEEGKTVPNFQMVRYLFIQDV